MKGSAFWTIIIFAGQFCFSGFAQTNLQENPRLVTQPKQVHGADWLAFSDDNRLLVSTHSTTATAIVWDVRSGREIRRFTRNTNLSGYTQNKYIAAAFSPDAERLAVFNVRNKEIKIWDIATGELWKQITVKTPDHVEQTAQTSFLSPELLVFFAYHEDHFDIVYDDEVQIWDFNTGEMTEREETSMPDPREFKFSFDTQFLLKREKKGTSEVLLVIETETKKELQSLAIGKDERTLAISLDGSLVATSDPLRGPVKIWSVPSGKTENVLEGYTNKYVKNIFTQAGLFTISMPLGNHDASRKSRVKLRNENTGTEVYFDADVPQDSAAIDPSDVVNESQMLLAEMGFKFDGWAGGFRLPVAVAENGKVVATESAGNIVISEPGKGRKISEVKLADGETLHTISASGKMIVTASFPKNENENRPLGVTSERERDDGQIRRLKIYDAEKSAFIAEFDTYFDGWFKNDVDFASFSTDEKFLAARSDGNLITIWDLSTKQKVKSIKICNEDGKAGCPAESVNAFRFSPNMQFLAVASSDSDDYQNGRVTISDIKTGNITHTLNIPPFTINSLAFSPDSNLLAVGGIDSTITLWDIARNKQTRLLEGHNYQISNLQFSPDGLFLLSESLDQTARLWNVSNGKEIIQLLNLTNDIWVTVTPEGRFDTDGIEQIKGLHWVIPSDPFATQPLDVFMRQYYEPGLLRRVLKCNDENNCDKEFKPLPSVGVINRVQTKVAIRK